MHLHKDIVDVIVPGTMLQDAGINEEMMKEKALGFSEYVLEASGASVSASDTLTSRYHNHLESSAHLYLLVH